MAGACARAAPGAPQSGRLARLQRRRRALQLGFFALFLTAPVLNLLRFDLGTTQLWLLGRPWGLGLDAFLQGQATATQAALNILLRGMLPALVLVIGFLAVAWRWGRLYCGWLCPHFSLVELLNGLLQRACGKLSLWDRHTTPLAGGRLPRRRWWPVWGLAALLFGFVWAITLLSYLLPPIPLWQALASGTLSANQTRFLAVGSAVFAAEFLFARHLFCRFGCAVGLFQSLAWMANPRALVVAFDRPHARDCRGCITAAAPQGAACDSACPMRLAPRNVKRLMFSCVQCGRCLTECAQSHAGRPPAALATATPKLGWAVGEHALRETLRQRRAEGPALQDAADQGQA